MLLLLICFNFELGGAKPLVFKKLTCLHNFAKNIDLCNREQRRCIADHLAPLSVGSSSHPVKKVWTEIRRLPMAAGEGGRGPIGCAAAPSARLRTPQFDMMWLKKFLYILLVFKADFLGPAGDERAQSIRLKLLAGWEYADGFTKYSRCMFWAMFDTTSLWITYHWLRPESPHSMTGAVRHGGGLHESLSTRRQRQGWYEEGGSLWRRLQCRVSRHGCSVGTIICVIVCRIWSAVHQLRKCTQGHTHIRRPRVHAGEA